MQQMMPNFEVTSLIFLEFLLNIFVVPILATDDDTFSSWAKLTQNQCMTTITATTNDYHHISASVQSEQYYAVNKQDENWDDSNQRNKDITVRMNRGIRIIRGIRSVIGIRGSDLVTGIDISKISGQSLLEISLRRCKISSTSSR